MKQIKTICLLLAAVISMDSCTTTDSTETTLYSDAVITAFTLGTLNIYSTTTADDGTQTTTKTTFAGSNYKFVIDQLNRQIYNNDSLPIGTDVAHVLCTISTVNNGIAMFQDLSDEDAYYYYSSTDSIDFSTPRKVKIFSSDGNGYTDYTIKLNVHRENGDDFVWQKMTDVPFPAEPALPAGIKQLLGSSTTELYGLSDDNKLMVSHDNGTTWEQDLADTAEDADKLPTKDVALVSYPMNLTDMTDYVLMAGTRQVTTTDENGTEQTKSLISVWHKIVDYSGKAPESQWSYMERGGIETYSLPCLQNLSLARYNDAVLAFGGDYRQIYQSRDNGITWQKNSLYAMPADFDYNATSVKVVTDEDNYIWLFCTGTNEVWRGRLNRLGWTYQ